ncbi:cleft lip and palate transmembrane protein 1-like protein [Contarinia nasturtii]|uniref:cleft lip and palate transmembrane protein 1-like protein n=1 Tax=Contarinia nasturtii TaxID=265458 RepID=UPI0012D45442|nr:cleft lip and palate transmembrane protein 1-like protein [Contarinia nasturtii]
MPLPSITVILGAIFMIYVSYSVYTLSQLFTTLQCTSTPCYTTILAKLPKLQLNLFVSPVSNPLTNDVTKIGAIEHFDYYKELKRDFLVDIPRKTYRNGTMYLHLVLVNDIGVQFEWRHLKREGLTILQRIALTEYMIPRPATFNLLNENEKEPIASQNRKTVSHWKPKIYVTLLTDHFSVSNQDIPPEMGPLIRITKDKDILPIVQNDFLKTRLIDLIEMSSNTTNLPLTFTYTPISIGKLRLILHVEHALRALKQFGFTIKDIDEVKGIFSEANLYLLCGTMFIGSVHLLFDFLSLKMTSHSGGRRRATWAYRYAQLCGELLVKL